MLERDVLPPHAVARWAARTPSATAIQHVDGTRLRYGELHAQGLAWARALAGLGVAATTHVASLLPNGDLGHRALLGLSWLRAIEVPLNPAYVGGMLEHALLLSDSEYLLTVPALLGNVRPLLARLPRLHTIVLAEGEAGQVPGKRVISAAGFAAAGEAAPADATFAGPEVWDVACLLFTSGTTGPSKAVITPWGLSVQMWSWVPPDTIGPGEGLFMPLPLFHNSGRSGFAYVMASGGRFVHRDRFSATSFWPDVRRTDCRAAALVGPMTRLLWSAPLADDDADNPLRAVIIGPMIPEMEEFKKRFGVKVATCYGQTEVGAPLATSWEHGPWQATGRQRDSYPGFEVRLVDAHDRPVADGEVGELAVRANEPWGLSLGYYKMPDESLRAWRNGWFHTGDMFTRDAGGNHTFFDRRRDVIRRRGENISSFEVEREVGNHPDVIECVAIAVPSGVGDDEVLAAVIVKDPATFAPASLIAFLAGRMPAFMIPRFVRVMPDFPRNATTARVRKDELRAMVLTDQGWDRLSAEA